MASNGKIFSEQQGKTSAFNHVSSPYTGTPSYFGFWGILFAIFPDLFTFRGTEARIALPLPFSLGHDLGLGQGRGMGQCEVQTPNPE